MFFLSSLATCQVAIKQLFRSGEISDEWLLDVGSGGQAYWQRGLTTHFVLHLTVLKFSIRPQVLLKFAEI